MTERTGHAPRGRQWLALCKPGLSLLVAAAAAAGYVAASPRGAVGIVAAAAGVFVLTAGAAALNQYQEREIDARMDRTRGRPLASGAFRPGPALGLALGLLLCGLALLTRGGPRPVILGTLAVAWYNGVYTPLKRTSPMAAVPGALSGALAPAVGWACAGGRLTDPLLAALGLVLFIWQIPHFWLVVLEHGPEYRGAGVPSILDILSEAQARRIVAHWVLATAAASLVIAAWGALRSPGTRWAILAMSLWLAGQALRFRTREALDGSPLFRAMNLHMAVLLILICADKLLPSG
jgi:protoheme IX farnesyltransferase